MKKLYKYTISPKNSSAYLNKGLYIITIKVFHLIIYKNMTKPYKCMIRL